MKQVLILLIGATFFSLPANGQKFFFIGEDSYPCTETFTLLSNANISYIDDLEILFARDGSSGLIVVASKTESSIRFSGKLYVYLNDGTVITCQDKGKGDNVDDISIAVYDLTDQHVSSLKTSNIQMVRYALGGSSVFRGNYTASNEGSARTDFVKLAIDFFDQ